MSGLQRREHQAHPGRAHEHGDSQCRRQPPQLTDAYQGRSRVQRKCRECRDHSQSQPKAKPGPGKGQKIMTEHDEHQALVDCIARRDGDGAARLMDEHLLALERNIELRQHEAEPSLGKMLGLR